MALVRGISAPQRILKNRKPKSCNRAPPRVYLARGGKTEPAPFHNARNDGSVKKCGARCGAIAITLLALRAIYAGQPTAVCGLWVGEGFEITAGTSNRDRTDHDFLWKIDMNIEWISPYDFLKWPDQVQASLVVVALAVFLLSLGIRVSGISLEKSYKPRAATVVALVLFAGLLPIVPQPEPREPKPPKPPNVGPTVGVRIYASEDSDSVASTIAETLGETFKAAELVVYCNEVRRPTPDYPAQKSRANVYFRDKEHEAGSRWILNETNAVLEIYLKDALPRVEQHLVAEQPADYVVEIEIPSLPGR